MWSPCFPPKSGTRTLEHSTSLGITAYNTSSLFPRGSDYPYVIIAPLLLFIAWPHIFSCLNNIVLLNFMYIKSYCVLVSCLFCSRLCESYLLRSSIVYFHCYVNRLHFSIYSTIHRDIRNNATLYIFSWNTCACDYKEVEF